MLILIYPRDPVSDANKKIDEMRTAYDTTFHQESVLREDHASATISARTTSSTNTLPSIVAAPDSRRAHPPRCACPTRHQRCSRPGGRP